MGTETFSERYRGLDGWASGEILQALLEGQLSAVAAVRPALPLLAAAGEAAALRLAAGGRLAYAGAGSSGRLAVQDGVEMTPTYDWPRERLAWLLAGGEAAMAGSIEGAEDDGGAAEAAVAAAGIGVRDVLIAVAASGRTVYTVAATRRARREGALTIGIANNPATPLLEAADHPILLDTGPEVVAGSTRMNAGTAQKVALNLLSTLVMVRLGRVHDGLMVDMRASNAKLEQRSRRMLMRLTGCPEEAAAEALRRCGGRLKPAVLVLAGSSPEEADRRLAAANGSLRRALALHT
jgi:N-acetylmuramic acid 6-phosphate etherase